MTTHKQEMERYGTINRWSKELRISSGAIRRRVKAAGKTGITGRLAKGRVVRNGFYGEDCIREICNDLLVEQAKRSITKEVRRMIESGELKELLLNITSPEERVELLEMIQNNSLEIVRAEFSELLKTNMVLKPVMQFLDEQWERISTPQMELSDA